MGWIALLVALVVATGLVGIAWRRRLGAGASGWRPAIEAAAASLGGRPAIAGGAAELRAERDGVTVTVRVRGAEVRADARLLPGARELRMWLGSGLPAVPSDLTYIPEAALPPAFPLDPPVFLRSDDAERGAAIAEACAFDLARLVEQTGARSVVLLARGGAVELSLGGAAASAAGLEALVLGTAKAVHAFGGDAAAAPKLLPAKVESAIVKCAFCGGERRPGVAWVRCARCAAPHHADCWETTKTCARPECGSAAAEPL